MGKHGRWIFSFMLAIGGPLFFFSQAQAKDLTGRLGIGMTNPYHTQFPAISIKIQRSPIFALGAMLGASFSDEDRGGYNGGIKFYRILFDEPQLNFYAAGAFSLVNTYTASASETGMQGDFTLGSEFHFQGLESLGFSFEFGVSLLRMYDEITIKTVGNHLIVGAVHFYL